MTSGEMNIDVGESGPEMAGLRNCEGWSSGTARPFSQQLLWHGTSKYALRDRKWRCSFWGGFSLHVFFSTFFVAFRAVGE